VIIDKHSSALRLASNAMKNKIICFQTCAVNTADALSVVSNALARPVWTRHVISTVLFDISIVSAASHRV
jgi:hypothetical protein